MCYGLERKGSSIDWVFSWFFNYEKVSTCVLRHTNIILVVFSVLYMLRVAEKVNHLFFCFFPFLWGGMVTNLIGDT